MALPSSSLTFDDEFTSFQSSPNGSSVDWATELPFWGAEHTLSGNHEAEYYVDSSQANTPFTDTNGVLTIHASPATTSSGNPLGLNYNSGAITTYKSFSQLYGYFEVRAQLPSGAGLWPAFWLMPTDFKGGPEIDVFEVLGDRPDVIHASVHSAVPGASLEQTLLVSDTSTAFHTYGVDWGPQKTVFYVDGQVIATAATAADMNVPMYMILNLAVGGAGSWPGAPTAQTQFPANLKLDYVHAYQTANTIGWTDPAPSPPTPLVLPAIQAAAVYGNAQAYVNVQHYGNEDGGTGLGGIGVALRNAAGLIVATGVTDTRGFYTFLNLAPGTYSVQYLLPEQYSIRPGNFADPSTGLTGTFSLSSGQDYPVPFQFVTSSAELTGIVQLNGSSIAKVIVSLLDANGTTLSTTSTDANGRFDFWTAAGQYEVSYAPLAETKLAAGSLADPKTGLTIPIALADGQAFMLIPEQLVSTTPNVEPPTVTLALSNDTGISASDKITSSSGLAGGGGVNASVTIWNGTSLVGATTADSQGNWLFTPTALPDGSYTLTASEIDAAGNTSSSTLAFVLDTTAPMVTIGLARDTGSSNSDKITSSAALAGNAEANATVTISNGATLLGTITSNIQGHWSFTPSLTDGSYLLTAMEIDPAGNSGSATLSLVLDTTAPLTTIRLATDTGSSSSDQITASSVLTGSGDSGAMVTIRRASAVLGTTMADSAGHWSYSPTGLTNGSYSLSATETDLAGNSGTATVAITLDTIAPKPAMKIITGNVGGGVTLAGVSEANSTVTIADTCNGVTTVVGSATTGTTGAWGVTIHGAIDLSKVHSYSTSSTDVAGNTGAMSGGFLLASTGNDILMSNANVSDVFAIMSFKGSDIIKGFEASSVVGANHDYIDLSGRGISSFGQVQSMMSGNASTVINIGSGKTITVSNIAPSLFTAADFRYS